MRPDRHRQLLLCPVAVGDERRIRAQFTAELLVRGLVDVCFSLVVDGVPTARSNLNPVYTSICYKIFLVLFYEIITLPKTAMTLPNTMSLEPEWWLVFVQGDDSPYTNRAVLGCVNQHGYNRE